MPSLRRVVTQVEVAELLTSIESVALVDDILGAIVSTSSSFSDTSITDGVPVAQKTIDAYVEGTPNVAPETDTISSLTHWSWSAPPNEHDLQRCWFAYGTEFR